MSSKTKASTLKIWVRIIAGTLAVVFAMFIIMLELTRINLSTDNDSAANSTAATLLADNTDYVNKSGAERAGIVINNLFTNPQTFENYYTLASMQIGQGSYDKALKNINRCLHEYKGSDTEVLDDLNMKKGCLETLLNDYNAALVSFDKVSQGSSRELELLRIKAQIFIEQSDYKGAKQSLLSLLKQDPGDTGIREILAQVYYLGGEYSLGISQYTRLIKELGDDGGILHFMRGMLYKNTQEYESAIADFIEAIGLGFAEEAVCYEQQSLCCYMLGRHEDALAKGELAIELGSDDLDMPTLYKYMGLSTMSLALYEDAVAYFSSAVEEDELIEDVHYYRGVCYMGMGDFASAIDDFTTSVELGFVSSSCLYNRAMCYLQSDEIDKAKDDLRQVVQLGGNEELVTTAKELLNELD